MHIRQATPADGPRVWELLEPVFRAGETFAVNPAISRADALHGWMDAPRATYVAESDGRIVGTYYLRPNQQGGGDHICNCGYIVDRASRGQGVAEAMCRHSQARAQAMGFAAMQFNLVVATNEGAVRLWQRLGFAVIGRIPDAFRHPVAGLVDALIMYKRL